MLFILPGGLGPVGAIPVVGQILVGAITVVEIIGALFGLTFGGGDVAKLATAVSNLNQQVATAVQQLTKFAWSIAYALGQVLQWIHDFFVGLLSTILSLLKKLAGLLKKIVTEVFPTVLRIIRQMRQFLNDVYLKYIRPILAWLQYLRGFLAILRLFHIGWAAKLDGYLTKLQGYILLPFQYVLRSINGIGSWINVIITAGGLIQRAIFVNTMYAYQRDWIGMWWNGQANAGGGGAPLPAQPQYVAPTPAQVSLDLDQFISTDTGDIAAAVQVSLQYGDAALAQIPPGP